MSSPHRMADIPEASLTPIQGWHCGHYFYRWNRAVLNPMLNDADAMTRGLQAFEMALNPADSDRPERFQSFIVSGHKADFGLVMMSPDPLKIDRVHQKLMSGPLGAAIEPTYSFVSVSEVSEYLPTKEQYAQKLLRTGETEDSPAFKAKVTAYDSRLPMMLAQRLAPEFSTMASYVLLSYEQV